MSENIDKETQTIKSTEIFGFDSDEEIMLIKCPKDVVLNSFEPISLSNEEIDVFLQSNDANSDSSNDCSIKEPFCKRKTLTSPATNIKPIKRKCVDYSGLILIPSPNDCKIPKKLRQQKIEFLLKEAFKLYPEKERQTAIELVRTEEDTIATRVTNTDSYTNLISGLVRKIRADVQAGNKKITVNAKNTDEVRSSDWKVLSDKLRNFVLTDDDMFRNGYPTFDPNKPGHVQFCSSQFAPKLKTDDDLVKCIRCKTLFDPLKNYFTESSEDQCYYHPNRRMTRGKNAESSYICCNATDSSAPPCSSAKVHVHEGREKEMTGYVKTPDCSGDDCECGIYALDCEMIYTTSGVELARVTLVDHDLQLVYDSLVKPQNKVVDYNTRFSGITEEQMKDAKTSFKDAQNVILSLLCRKSILIGHSMENDLICLKIVHETVVDTSVMFPHKRGFPYKCALRNLAMTNLNKVIQNDITGHDSFVDAATCVELAKLKVGL